MTTAQVSRYSTGRAMTYYAIGVGTIALAAVASTAASAAISSVSTWLAIEVGATTGTFEIVSGGVTYIIYVAQNIIEYLGRVVR